MNDTRICSETGTVITRDMVAGCISDTYKSVYGSRPRHLDYSLMTFDEMGDMLTELQEQAEVEYNREMEWEQEQEVKREAKILELIGMGANDRETAERWLAEA